MAEIETVVFDAGHVRRPDRNGRMIDLDLAGFLVDPFVLMDKLAALGSADAIAEFLAAEGISGALEGVATKCPVAVYFARETGVTPCFGVDSWSPMHIEPDEESEAGGEPYFDLPAAVGTFIEGVDLGHYPELAVSPDGLTSAPPEDLLAR